MFCKSRVIRSIVLLVYRGTQVNREEEIQKFEYHILVPCCGVDCQETTNDMTNYLKFCIANTVEILLFMFCIQKLTSIILVWKFPLQVIYYAIPN